MMEMLSSSVFTCKQSMKLPSIKYHYCFFFFFFILYQVYIKRNVFIKSIMDMSIIVHKDGAYTFVNLCSTDRKVCKAVIEASDEAHTNILK